MSVPPPTLGYAPTAPESNPDARTFGMLCHLAALSGLLVPFGNILGPLIFWLIKKDQHPFVDRCGKEALNFQISIFIYMVVAAITIIVLIGFVLVPAVYVFGLVMSIVAGVKANDGSDYRYPLTIRLIS